MSRICAIIQELESTEFVADFVTTAGAVGTDDEDDKTISQKDDKHINMPLGALYIALSRSISRYLATCQFCDVSLQHQTLTFNDFAHLLTPHLLTCSS